MIQEKPNFTIATDESLSQAKFSLKGENLAHVFDILRNNLYSDKILAVIREYSTNAFDANVENNKEFTPIEVTLPSIIDPVFQVRDFGKGLSEEDIFEIYSSYGASTKRNSNKLVGTLGMGSKSAFGYADSFNVTSWHDGIKKVYLAYIDESKIGTICKVHEEKSNEPTGIAVTVSVNKDDIGKFTDTAKQFYAWFNPLPVFKNSALRSTIEDRINKMIIYHKSDNCTLFSEHYSYESKVYVKMGNICYPLPINCGVDLDWLKSSYHQLVINVNIGDVSFTTSRESLEITKKTVELLNDKIAIIKNEVYQKYQQLIDACKTPFDAIRYYNTLPNLPKKMLSGKIIWKSTNLDFNRFGDLEWTAYQESNRQWKKAYGLKFDESENIAFIINDGGFPNSQLRDRLMIARDVLRAENKYSRIVFGRGTVESSKAFIQSVEVQGAKVFQLSSININVVKQRKNKSTFKKSATLFKWNGLTSFPYSTCWEQSTVNSNDTIVYLEIDAYKPKDSTINELKHKIKNLKDAGYEIDVYGVKKGQKIEKNWISLAEYMQQKIAEICDNADFKTAFTKIKAKQLIANNPVSKSIFGGAFTGKENTIACPLTKELIEFATIKDFVSEKYNEKWNLVHSYGSRNVISNLEKDAVTYANTFEQKLNKFNGLYPLFLENSSYYGITSGKANMYINYINAMYKCGNTI